MKPLNAVILGVMVLAQSATAAVIPSWRINTISPTVIASAGGQLTPSSTSISLLVETTNGSTLAGGGIDLTIPLLRFYQWRRFGTDALEPPSVAEIEQFPTAGFDTFCTAPVIGRLNGAGPPLLANTNLQPLSNLNHRTGELLNIAWGPISQPGVFELLTLTVASGTLPDLTPIPLHFGRLHDGLDINSPILLPPIPIAMTFPPIPEPGFFSAGAGAFLVFLNRRCLRGRVKCIN